MELKQVLSLSCIDLHATASTKKRALELISECCANPAERPDFFYALVEREKLGSTGLGYGVALPHARLPNLHTPLACFFKLEKPIDYEAPDKLPVDLIIGLFVPEQAHDAHLQLLSQIASIFNNESLRTALRQCEQAQDALSLITQPLGDKILVS